jgi:hypothetical protein
MDAGAEGFDFDLPSSDSDDESTIPMRRSSRSAEGALHSELLSPLAYNLPPRRGVVSENIALVRRSTRRATAALHGELISVL